MDSHYNLDPDGVRWGKRQLKDVDPATFQIVGEQYGRTPESAWFRAKRVRLKKNVGGTVEAFREIGPGVATDGAWLYNGTRQVPPPPPTRDGSFDWRIATYIPLEEPHFMHLDGRSMGRGVVSDGQRHFVGGDDAGVWFEVPSDRIRPLSGTDYLTDGTTHFFHDGREVVGARGRAIHGIAPQIVAAGDELFLGAEPFPDPRWEASDLQWVFDAYVRAGDALLEVDARAGEVHEIPAPPAVELPQAATAFLEVVLPCMAYALDHCLPVATMGLSALREPFQTAPDTAPFAFLLLEATPGRICIEVEGTEFAAPPGAWYELACRAWAHTRGRDLRLVALMDFATTLPSPRALADEVLMAAEEQAMAYAASLDRAGATDAAGMIAFWTMCKLPRRGGLAPAGLALYLTPGTGAWARYQRDYLTHIRTNLAAVRFVLREGRLAHPDARIRFDSLDILVGATLDAAKADKVLPLAVPALIERTEREQDPTLRTAAWIGLDGCTVKALVSAEVNRVAVYDELERATRHLIAHGVNPDLNRVRLYEALWGQGRDDEAAALEAELAASGAAHRPYPGAYVRRPVAADVQAALQAVRERAVRD